jgi:5-methylcytosine-specific restriction endonuclease McrA
MKGRNLVRFLSQAFYLRLSISGFHSHKTSRSLRASAQNPRFEFRGIFFPGEIRMNIVARLKELVAEERKITAEVIRLLLEIEDAKIFATQGYSSVFEFCVKELGYSDGAAYRRISAMRLYRRDERCAEKIESGELSLSSAAKVETTLRQAERQDLQLDSTLLFEAVLGASSREADKKLEEVLPFEKPCQLPTSLQEKIEKLRALLARQHQTATREEILHLALDEALAAHAPSEGNLAGEVKSPQKRHVPAKLRAAILHRDGHRCTYMSEETGQRCESRTFLELDHIQPFAHGGLTLEENLKVLCRSHNQLVAEEHGMPQPRRRGCAA